MDAPANTATKPAPGPIAALGRWGTALLGPRRYASAAEPTVGQRDALWLGALFVVGTALYPVAEAVATLWATRNLNGGLMLASALGRALLAPIITLVVVETILGDKRRHQRAIGLLPLVILGTAAHALRQMGASVSLPMFAPEIAGAVLGAGLAFWIRPAVVPHSEESSDDA